MNTRRSIWLKAVIVSLTLVLLLQGCGTKLGSSGNSSELDSENRQAAGTAVTSDETAAEQPGSTLPEGSPAQQENSSQTGTSEQSMSNVPAIDLKTVKPDESGKIMVVMFHNFIDEYKKGDKAYTTTFDAFRELLGTLYSSGYRLISLTDYLNGNINTPAGCIPMVFTFDDGTAGQFNLIDDNGTLKTNPRSAVGILEEFNKTHPDFGMKATFYLNLGNQTFAGAGTLSQRLEYLVGKGFELGNHTYTHINLKKTYSADKIQEEIGGNQKKMYELIPDYAFTAFSLPFGEPSKELTQYVIKGVCEGVKYENRSIVEVGWDPSPSPFSAKLNPLSVHRVRASGIEPVQADLAWWLENLKRDKQYVSDGNPNTVTVPEANAESVDQSRLNGRTLVKY